MFRGSKGDGKRNYNVRSGLGGGLVGGQGAVVGLNQNFHRFKGEAERSMTD